MNILLQLPALEEIQTKSPNWNWQGDAYFKFEKCKLLKPTNSFFFFLVSFSFPVTLRVTDLITVN